MATSHTPGPWRAGKLRDAVVSDTAIDGGPSGTDAVDYYGGHLVAESVAPCNRPLIVAAPKLLQALREVVGDCYYLDNPGGTPRCNFCQELEGEPHDPDCTMQFVLAAIVEAEGAAV